MISAAYIKEWRQSAPWQKNDQVEQDLIISRSLIEIFNHSVLAENLAFRGGTALYKLHVQPVRYSSEGRITLTYRMTAESGSPLKLKVEINSREHFSILGLEKRTLDIQSRWFSGSAAILTYQFDELLGTKMRALYQRKKGRDLFDLWNALNTTGAESRRVIDCFLRYMKHEGHKVSRAEFEQNLIGKLDDPTFVADVGPLLIADTAFDFETAARDVINKMLPFMPGEPWQG